MGDGISLALVEEGDAVVVENPGGTVEERAEVARSQKWAMKLLLG